MGSGGRLLLLIGFFERFQLRPLCRLYFDAGAQAVANVVGQWMQEEDGRGAFLGHILLATGDPREPVLAVGRVVGTFRTPPPDSGRRQVGLADLRWSVAY
jgi:hypothetical protein